MLNVVFFGNNERGCVCLEEVAKNHNVQAVFGLTEQPEWSRNLFSVAREVCPDCLRMRVDDPNTKEIFFLLTRLNPDVIIMAGYPKLFGGDLIENFYCINLHASWLPRYRGPAPINWVIIDGVSRTGISIIRVDHGVDTGNILGQETFLIDPEDNYLTVLMKTLEMYPPLLTEVLYKIEQHRDWRGLPQDRLDGFWCSKRYPEDGLIRWREMTDIQVHNLCRALVYPMPGARLILNAASFPPGSYRNIVVQRTRLIKQEYRGVPGRIGAIWPSGVVMLCKNRGLLIETVLNEDGKEVHAAEVIKREDTIPWPR